jgi:hypothetical protein
MLDAQTFDSLLHLAILIAIIVIGVKLVSALTDAATRLTATTTEILNALTNVTPAADITTAVQAMNDASDKLDAAAKALSPPSG